LEWRINAAVKITEWRDDYLDNENTNCNHRILEIDFSQLMDLRIDYAFKLIFGTGGSVI